jgi:hypothetical protein
VPILRLLRGSPYGPREIEIMTAAYQEALHLTGVTDRTSAVAELMAKSVIDRFSTGEDDPHELGRRVAKEFNPMNLRANRGSQSESSP